MALIRMTAKSFRATVAVCIALLCIAAVVGLTAAGHSTGSVVELMLGVLPATITGLLATKASGEAKEIAKDNARQLADVKVQTNGPLTAMADQVNDLHVQLAPADQSAGTVREGV